MAEMRRSRAFGAGFTTQTVKNAETSTTTSKMVIAGHR